MPELSVIVATHNRLEVLRRKLEHLHNQDLPLEHFEVLVVADGCSDGSEAFLADFRPKYAFAWFHTNGWGAARARNLAIEQARGRFVLLSDDDVFPEPDVFRLHLEAQHRQAAVYVGEMHWENGEARALSYRFGRLHWTTLNGANCSFPRAEFEAVGGFWEGFSGYGGEDLELGFKLARAGLQFYYLEAARSTHVGSPSLPDLNKARSAGRQAMHAFLHHRDLMLGLELGVHPVLLCLKLLLFPRLKPWLGARADYELAYAQGAWEMRSFPFQTEH